MLSPVFGSRSAGNGVSVLPTSLNASRRRLFYRGARVAAGGVTALSLNFLRHRHGIELPAENLADNIIILGGSGCTIGGSAYAFQNRGHRLESVYQQARNTAKRWLGFEEPQD